MKPQEKKIVSELSLSVKIVAIIVGETIIVWALSFIPMGELNLPARLTLILSVLLGIVTLLAFIFFQVVKEQDKRIEELRALQRELEYLRSL